MKNKGLFKTILALFFTTFFLLTSCNNAPNYVENPKVKNLSKIEINELQLIKDTGIQVVQQGMRFTFIIPVDDFFMKTKQQLLPNKEEDLDLLSHFIRHYATYFARPAVTVTGFSDKVLLRPARVKLSRFYANTVATNLEENGIPSEIITVKGEGAANPIASNSYPIGTAFNRRVEVVVHG